MEKNSNRNITIDVLRGIAILLVVLGHTMTGCTNNSESSFLFIDEEGNITALKESDMETYSACKHSYKSGTTKKHILLKNGGCWVETHKAKI